MSRLSRRLLRYAVIATVLGFLLAQATSGLSARLSAVLLLPGLVIWSTYLAFSYVSDRKMQVDKYKESVAKQTPSSGREEILKLVRISVAETIDLRASLGANVLQQTEIRRRMAQLESVGPSRRAAVLEEILNMLGSTKS